MHFRIALATVTLFWCTMTFLLWRSEYGDRSHQGNAVPLELVWRKILTAPDNSTLDILHHGKKSGFCRWAATVAEEGGATRAVTDGTSPEGMISRPRGYRLDLDGNLTGEEFVGRVHFNVELKLNSARAWQEFGLRLNLDRDLVEVRTAAAQRSLHYITVTDGERVERTIPFDDFQKPEALARDFGLAVPLALWGMGGWATNGAVGGKDLLPGINWQARNDWITIGHTSARVYRLKGKVLDRFEFSMVVSPVGEILRVELPDGWTLVNDQAGSW
jgi:hypothetical protein